MTLSNLTVEFYEKLSSWEERVVKDSGLSLPQMHTIEMIGIYGSMKMRDLADRLGVTTGTLTIMVDRLESKKYLERTPNPGDRRSYLISLTETGEKKYREHTTAHKEMTNRCLGDFSEEEQQVFISFLNRFIERI
jgi:DNA-binding MarR family transcriptional regulator